MPDDIEKINEIFRIHDENARKKSGQTGKTGAQPAAEPENRNGNGEARGKTSKHSAVDNFLIDKTGEEKHNYTGDEMTERDYHPVRQSREYRSGCLGGIMYFVFVAALSVVLACFAWMAASDALALNKDNFTAVVNLPSDIFEIKTVDDLDENGKKIGTKRVSQADVSYVADQLKDAGLIEYKWLFEAFCKISHASSKVDPGSYELRSSFDYRALIKNMQSGSGATLTTTVTIPEGFSMHQTFLRLEEEGVCSYNELMDAAANATFNYSFIDPDELGNAYRLEGFLFPDTYEFYVGMQASSAINKMLENFYYKQTEEMLQRAEELGLSMRDIVNIASLIEKEAANDEERPIIASVIYNRLAAGTPLGIDASILYLYPDHEGGPTAEMLAQDSPYNTRMYAGLPPTPISNPGIASINAALYPISSDYFYYALDTETGTHRFFNNSAEFDAFVATQNYG